MICGRVLALSFLALVVGCNETPEKKCVTVQMKFAKKGENCGIAAAPPKEEIQKNCDALSAKERKEAIERNEHFLEAETCEALKVRVADYANKLMDSVAKEQNDQMNKMANDPQFQQQNKEFNEAFKKALEESQKQKQEGAQAPTH